VVVKSYANLLEIVSTLHPIGCLADFLHRRNQQANQNSNDGNNYQQLDKSEGISAHWRILPK
jgi:hypothetical protein